MNKNHLGKIKLLLSTLIMLFYPVSTVLYPLSADATPSMNLTGVSSLTGTTGEPVSLSGIHFTGSTGFSTSLQLRATEGQLELTDTTGVTVTSSNPSNVLSFSGTIAELDTALSHVTYTRSSGTGDDTIEISSVDDGQVYYPGNGHVYQLVDTGDPEEEGGGIDWEDAKAAADSTSYNGSQGYLATITSQDENDYVAARLTGEGWMGASDSATEGDWKWVDGPENGTSFWSGASEGSAVGENYQNWNEGEPNDSVNEQELDGGEDCAQFLAGGTGKWNDLPCTGHKLQSYVVEFGNDETLPQVVTKNVTVSISAAVREASTCQELSDIGSNFSHDHDTIKLTADIDCHGNTVEPLFSYNGFYGTFDGQGHTIKNFNIDGINNSYSEGNAAGLFVFANNATIKNVNLSGGTIEGYNAVGSLVGWGDELSVENVTSSMAVHGLGNAVGGLVGGMSADDPDVHISGSSATGTVGGSQHVGGLVGEIYSGDDGGLTIEKTFATGDVTASTDTAGGLIGYINAEGWGDPSDTVTIQDVYAQGDVSVGEDGGSVGGLIGSLYVYEDGAPTSITVRRAYASGSVSGDFNVGGLIGYLRGPDDEDVGLSVTDTFAAGAVTSADPDTAGAVVGRYDDEDLTPTWSGNYFDQTRSTQSDCVGQGNPGSCTAENADGSQSSYFFRKTNAPMNTWDFDSIWVDHSNTYPTFSGINDGDEDGIDTAIEQAAPNDGDANGDGTADSQQANVSSFVDNQTGKYVSLEVSSECVNTEAGVASEASKVAQDSGFDYPAGLMSFTSNCGTNGFTATINQYYYGVSSNGLVARKFNPANNAYFMIPGATISSVTVGGQSVTKVSYQVKDGGDLDLDKTANGVIVDPAGPANSAVGTPNTGVRSWQSILPFKVQ